MAIKSSQRLSSKVAYYLDGIVLALKVAAANIYKYVYDTDIDPDTIQVNILNSTEVDFNNTINTAEMTTSALDAVTNVLDKFASMLESYGDMIDKQKLGKFITAQAGLILPSCTEWFNNDTIQERIKNSDMQEEMGDQMGGDEFGGMGMGGDEFGGDMGGDFGSEEFGNEGGEDLGEEGGFDEDGEDLGGDFGM